MHACRDTGGNQGTRRRFRGTGDCVARMHPSTRGTIHRFPPTAMEDELRPTKAQTRRGDHEIGDGQRGGQEQKQSGPSARMEKQSGASVRRKLSTFLMKNTLTREEGTARVIQKLQELVGNKRARGEATMV